MTPPIFWETWALFIFAVIGILGIIVLAQNRRVGALNGKVKELEDQAASAGIEVMQKSALIEERDAQLRQTVEELTKSKQALAVANRVQLEHRIELTQFLAVASHDMRQPMHALNIYLGVLSDSELPAAARDILEKLRQCALIMDKMFLSMLDLSRLDAEVVQPNVRAFPLASICAAIELEYASHAKRKGLILRTDVGPDWVESDPELVLQILGNLVANAVRYTETGSIAVCSRICGECVHLTVCDTGVGMAKSRQKTSLEDYFRPDATAGRQGKRLGMGLAIVRRLCKLLETPISLESELGKGSTFSLELKLAPQGVGRGEIAYRNSAAIADDGALRGKSLVVIDDEQSILTAMTALLEQWGCRVIAAKSVAEAIESLIDCERSPDAILCDYRLQDEENGIDAIECVRNEFNRDIPALLITGDTAPELLYDTLSSGLPVLYKPLQTDELRDALIDLLAMDGKQSSPTQEQSAWLT